MESTGITPVMNMAGNEGYGGSWIFLFAILALMWGGNGFGSNAASRAATVEDLSNQSNFSRLESQVQNNGNLVETKMDTITNGLSTLGYEIAGKFAATDANVTAQTQKVLDAIAANKIETLQAQVSQLQLQQALCGVVRYPTTATYTAGYAPYLYGGTSI